MYHPSLYLLSDLFLIPKFMTLASDPLPFAIQTFYLVMSSSYFKHSASSFAPLLQSQLITSPLI